MRVELDTDETWTLLALFVQRITDEVQLSDEDRGRIRRWRSEQMKASGDAIRQLAAKVNADMERALKAKERSRIQKPDWR